MKVGLFIPCYINAIYPHVGVASYRLLRSLGVEADYPLDQTCCGQPMANAGFENESAKLARRFDELFKDYDYVVGPSASCVAFVRLNHPAFWLRPDMCVRVPGRCMTFVISSTMWCVRQG